MTVVAKFGGSSLSDATQFEKVKQIVTTANQRVIVVSALGKRSDADNKLTDLFYSVFENTSQSAYYDNLWQEIVNRFLAVKAELNLTYDVAHQLDLIKQGLAARSLTVDYLVSRGEYLTARLMSEYLGYTFYDAKDYIIFDGDGQVDYALSYANIATLPKDEKIIVPGFYGACQGGKIKLFSRGGSDITGAIFAAGLKADVYENYSDVSGVLMADPRIVKNPAPIPVLTYDEMSAVANMGAQVLHRKSVYPVKKAGIPIHIKNTNAPMDAGTRIINASAGKEGITGFFGKIDYTFLTLHKNRAAVEIGFMRKVFEIFETYRINIEQSLTCIDQVGILVSSVDVKYTLEKVIHDLKELLGVTVVDVKEDMSLLGVFGRGMLNDPQFLMSLFAALKDAGIKPELIEQSPHGLSLVLGILNVDYHVAINVLYDQLVRDIV